MRILFLDDNSARLDWARRTLGPGNDLVLAETACETVVALESGSWDLVFLDHDLGGETFVDPADLNTGSEVARWIKENLPRIGHVVVHSMNTPAAWGMVHMIRDAGYSTEYIAFLRLIRVPGFTDEINRLVKT